jgi:hypothetical protein
LTPREFQARAKVREIYMAMWRSELRNAPHFTRSDKKPWKVDDFLKPETITEAPANDKAAVMLATAQLGMGLRDNPDMLPDWAIKKWKAA